MDSQKQPSSDDPQSQTQASGSESTGAVPAGGDQLADELSRLAHKFAELLETAWNSEQRRQIEQEVRSGLTGVSKSLEDGLKDLSEKEQAKDFVGKAESVADNVGEKVRASEIANELARGLAQGLHVLADQMDKLVQEMRSTGTASQPPESDSQGSATGQDIPISEEKPKSAPDA